MTTQTESRDAIFRKAREPYVRSTLFEWLLENHDQLKAAAGGRRLEWTMLCREFARQGLTDMTGKPPSPETARQTWWRVRKEKKRREDRDVRERAEREARRTADPRRNMPSRFPKGEYGPPLATLPSDRAQPPGRALVTTSQQRAQGLQLSTAEGVVVTKISRVFKTERATSDFMFEDNGMIVARCRLSQQLRVKQEFNKRGHRHVNDRTDELKLYDRLGLRCEKL